MPEICRFLGIIIRMYYDDNAPPHFHVYYNEFAAKIDIETGGLLSGDFPSRKLKAVQDWAKLHQKDLLENWRNLADNQPPKAIAP